MSKALSIIIPTYNESENFPILFSKLDKIQSHFSHFEVIIIDDNSPDGSESTLKKLQKHYPWLNYSIRKTLPKDLSLAVLEGLIMAKHDTLLVMDADLSHSPSSIIQLTNALTEQVDFVIGSRFVDGGSIARHWPFLRRCNAWIAKQLVRGLTRANDPLSGFFCLRRSTFDKRDPMNPIGYKIGLELIVKCRCKNIIEVPIHFANRELGKSKLNLKQQINYLKHLGRLYFYRLDLRKKQRKL